MSYSWPAIETPKISVVVCNYNYEKFICTAIQSVTQQTISAYEIIVVDDGSTDNSVDVIKTHFPHIKLIQKENGGQISAYNRGFENVTGDVVLFLDSDDELLPNALRDISIRFKDDVVKVHGKIIVMDKEGKELDTVLPSYLDDKDCGIRLINQGALYKSPPASANAYRVAAMRKLFPLPQTKDEKHGADYFCIYGICLLGLINKIDYPIIRYRIHQSSTDTVASLGFGNALKKQNREAVMHQRWVSLTEWLNTRLGRSLKFKEQYLDFTQQKLFYASDVLNAENFKSRCQVLKSHSPTIFKSINARSDLNVIKKAVLYLWLFLLLLLPNKLRLYVAKQVCNPIK